MSLAFALKNRSVMATVINDLAYVAKLGYLDGHNPAMVDGDRVNQSIEGMERACFQETNRLRATVCLTTPPDPHARWCGRCARATGPLSRFALFCLFVTSIVTPRLVIIETNKEFTCFCFVQFLISGAHDWQSFPSCH